MILKDIIDEDFTNYKKPAMFIITPKCNFKCCIEAKSNVCQNSDLVKLPDLNIDTKIIINRYLNNSITSAIVFGGLEPFDTFDDILEFIILFRQQSQDDIVIYTGYYENEIQDKIEQLKKYSNIIIKFGRFIPNSLPIHDNILGIDLVSNNQYAVKL